jgi:hypothetical protein
MFCDFCYPSSQEIIYAFQTTVILLAWLLLCGTSLYYLPCKPTIKSSGSLYFLLDSHNFINEDTMVQSLNYSGYRAISARLVQYKYLQIALCLFLLLIALIRMESIYFGLFK